MHNLRYARLLMAGLFEEGKEPRAESHRPFFNTATTDLSVSVKSSEQN